MDAKQSILQAGNKQPVTAALIPEARLRIQTVTQLTGWSASTIRRKMAAGDFPQPVRDGKRCTRWVAADVIARLRQDRGTW
jgi:prophage regulatory protein